MTGTKTPQPKGRQSKIVAVAVVALLTLLPIAALTLTSTPPFLPPFHPIMGGGATPRPPTPPHTFTTTSLQPKNEYYFLNKTELIQTFAETQNLDGGFGSYGSPPSTTEYTCLSLLALHRLGGLSQIDLDAACGYLSNSQNPDGGFGLTQWYQPSDPSNLYYTYLVVHTLFTLGRLNEIDYLAAANWIASLQWSDGSWGDTVNTMYAVVALNETGQLSLVNTTLTTDYIDSNPPRGVWYGNGGYLATPQNNIPTLQSTHAAVLTLLYLNESTLIHTEETVRFIGVCQNATNGGFHETEFSTVETVTATFYGLEAAHFLNALDKIDRYRAAAYMMFRESESDTDLLSLIVRSLHYLSDTMVPVVISVSALEVLQGEPVTFNATLVNIYGEALLGANATITYNNSTYLGFELGDGDYQWNMDTTHLWKTYNTTITANLTGYDTFSMSFNITVLKQIVVVQLLKPASITEGGVLTVTLTLEDGDGNPVENATVTMLVQGRLVNLTAGKGGNTYTAATSIDSPGSFNIRVTVQKENYRSETITFTVTVQPLLNTITPLLLFPLSPTDIFLRKADIAIPLISIGLVVGLAGVLWTVSPKSRRLQSYWGELWYIKLLAAASAGMLTSSLLILFFRNAQLDLGLLKPTLTPPIAFAIGVIAAALLLSLSISYTPRVRRMAVGATLSWGMLALFILLFTQSAGVVTSCIAAAMVLTTAFGCIKRPHLRERLMKSLITSLVLWSVGIFILVTWTNMLMNPWFTQGTIINSFIATSMGGYFMLWQLYLLIFIPVGHLWYTINQVSKTEKIDPDRLLSSMVNRTKWIK